MKANTKGLIVILLLFSAVVTYAGNPTYTLKQALDKKLVTAEIKGGDSLAPSTGGHYGKCIQIQLTNLTKDKFNVQVDAGQQLEPGDTSIQTMMVTEGLMFAFKGAKTQKKYVNAMCIQKHDGGPNKLIKFKTGSMSNGYLLSIALLVEKHKFFDATGQSAVWCISDNAPIEDIDSEDTVKLKILQEFVAKATGQKIPSRKLKNTPQEPQRHFKTTVTFEWVTRKASLTTLVVLDMNNNPVMEIIKDVSMPGGTYTEDIVLSTLTLPEGEYKVVLYLNKQVFMQKKIKLGR